MMVINPVCVHPNKEFSRLINLFEGQHCTVIEVGTGIGDKVRLLTPFGVLYTYWGTLTNHYLYEKVSL